jgi:hypothetical protein
MATTLDLSSTLRGKLATVARRIRLLRALRGVSLLLLTLTVTAGLALGADYLFTLSPLVRGVLFGVWTALGVLVALFGLVLPVLRSLDPAALAAVIEEKYPELGERLTSSVELAAAPDTYHGSPALIALLLEETEVRTRPLNFLSTVSPRRPLRAAAAAAVVLALAAIPGVLWQDRLTELAGRFLAPWNIVAEPLPYAVHAVSGDQIVRQGGPVTLIAAIEFKRPGVEGPPCDLVVTDRVTGQTQRFHMAPALTSSVTEAKRLLGAEAPAAGGPASEERSLRSDEQGGVAAHAASAGGPASEERSLRSDEQGGVAAHAAGQVAFFDYKVDHVGNSFTWHVEAGESRSTDRGVTSIVPVEIARQNGLVLTPVAPDYARRAGLTERAAEGVTELNALQHSQVRFDFRFNRDAVKASLLVATLPNPDRKVHDLFRRRVGLARSLRLPCGKLLDAFVIEPLLGDRLVALQYAARLAVSERPAPVDTDFHPVPLTLTEDRKSASCEVALRADQQYRIVLEAEHGIRTEYGPCKLIARPDQPPGVTYRGKDELPPVGVNDRVTLNFSAEDDVAVSRAAIEYQVNRGKVAFDKVELRDAGKRVAQTRHDFSLAGKVKPGDTVRYRIVAWDNRDVPDVKPPLKPQVGYYPLVGWLTLKVSGNVKPLGEREILAQRDDIHNRLEKIKKELEAERRQAYKVQQESRNDDLLAPQHREQLDNLRGRNEESRKGLSNLAQDAAESPALENLARKVDDVARGELSRTQDALNSARKADAAPKRFEQLRRADRDLESAVRKLDALQKENQRLAQQRLDQMRLENLAARQKELAKKAEELASRDPVRDPMARKEAQEARAEQNRVAEELRRLAAQSPDLQKALEAARAEQARELADRARELAQTQRDLAQAGAETERQRQGGRLAELTRRQEELTRQAEQLALQTRTPADSARIAPLRPQEAEKAAEALRKGNTAEALRHQDKAALELERMNADLNRAARMSEDPRQAAQQLARLEDALNRRVGEEAARKDGTPLAQRLEPLQQEQKAVADLARELSVPPQNRDAQKARDQAVREADQATQALKQNDTPAARKHLDEARKALQRLAYEMPELNRRRQQARRELERIRRQQEDVARQAEQVTRQLDKTDPQSEKTQAQAARQQAEAAERLSKLDPAGQENRKDQAQQALNRALADLLDGRKEDVTASQQEAKRELQRLEQALAGQKPADEKAQELAQRQKQLADQAAELNRDPKATPAAKQELQNQQQQVAREARALDAPEAPLNKEQAAKAAEQAAQAAKAQPLGEETQQKMQQAAQALQKLADQMRGRETEAAKADRLAREQARAAAQAEQRAQAGRRPAPAEQQRQQQIAQEARNLRAGEEAQKEKAQARQALERAQQGNDPKELARNQRQAADALRDLADRMAGRNDAAAKAAELAREQRNLADQAARGLAAKPQAALERARQQQEELARQLGRLPKQGAAEQRQQAQQKTGEAQKALQNARTPADAKEPLARAAQATEDLARQLGKEQAAQQAGKQPGERTAAKPAEQSPQRAAQQAAQQQRELARATEQARKQAEQGGEQGKQAAQKALEGISGKQQELNRQASQIPADGNQRALQQARQAMNQAQQALGKNDAAQAQRKQQEAAQALENLARQLPQQPQGQQQASRPQQGQPQQGQPQGQQPARPQGLPSRQQAEKAQALAQRQRELRKAVAEATRELARPPQPTKNPVGELVRQQQQIARQAAELARNVQQEQGQRAAPTQQAQQAQQAAQQASRKMQAGALPQAQQAAEQTAQDLRRLASQLAQTPRNARTDPQAADPLDQARRLAQKQEELNQQLTPLSKDCEAQQAQQQAGQQNLQRQAAGLGQELAGLAQESGRNPQASAQARQAALASQQAGQAMQRAQQQSAQGQQPQSHQSQQQAAQALDRAAQRAQQAAERLASAAQQGQPQAGQQPGQPSAQTQAGQSVQQAQGQMGQAQQQLGKGQSQQAGQAMQQAAQSLQQASQQLAQAQQQRQPGQPGQPGAVIPTFGASAGGLPDLSRYGPDAKKYQGKRWGELPGDLRTRIVQDLKGQFGEDYAEKIKLYFEQIAENGRP